jgi:hypothetical protein
MTTNRSKNKMGEAKRRKEKDPNWGKNNRTKFSKIGGVAVPKIRWFTVKHVLENNEYYLLDLTFQQIKIMEMEANRILPIPIPIPICYVRCAENLTVGEHLKGTIVDLIPLPKPINHGFTSEPVTSQGIFVITK